MALSYGYFTKTENLFEKIFQIFKDKFMQKIHFIKDHIDENYL